MKEIPLVPTTGLFTDFYELTMASGYFSLKHNPRAVFDMFFRKPPFAGGFSIFAGLKPLLDALENLRFSADDIGFLGTIGLFEKDFLDFLAGFRFTGDVWAFEEGSVVFPNEPILRIEGCLLETQIIESLLLNTVNFQTLIATKAARMYLSSGKGELLEFGLRRAQGSNGAMAAARAAFIGGVRATSNTLAGKAFGIPVRGTMAHSWVMSFETELEAFEKYAELYPNNCVLLIDTYDTLESGLKNAIIVGKKLKEKGIDIFGVRLDSGDLEFFSKEVRKQLDEAGLEKAAIVVSNELSEEVIQQLVLRSAPINVWGVGTNLVTAAGDPSLSGVYKLAQLSDDGRESANGHEIPVMKRSNNPEKMNNPGRKQVFRFTSKTGKLEADVVALEQENFSPDMTYRLYHPLFQYRHFDLAAGKVTPMLSRVMKNGKKVMPDLSLDKIRKTALSGIDCLDESFTRLLNPHIYRVSLSEKLMKLKFSLIEKMDNNRRAT
ncbi:MAG: nicotinate phosphoribosyltransferase [Spirochaetaceae bacterium]|nr:MAG: nicotinate phosphoribosyltransferase [Spirochaetaceae bacterium]